MHGGVGGLLMKGGSRKIAHARDETGVLNSPGIVKQLWRDRSNIGIFKWLDHVLDPIGLIGFNVVVQENETRTGSRFRSSVTFRRKVEGLIEGDKTHLGR